MLLKHTLPISFFLRKLLFILSVCIIVPFVFSCAHHHGMHHHSMHNSTKAAAENKPSTLNTVIEDLVLTPLNGKPFQLSELKNKKAIIIFMREQDCPISEKYGPRIARLETTYSQKDVQFIYIYVGQVRKETNSRSDLKRFHFKGPYVLDHKHKVVNTLSAKTTGDVFILTPERRLIYKGPLDDQYHLLKSAIRVRNHYVRDVLDTVLSGKTMTPKELPAPGCIISPPLS